jgi:hypothetical protein
MVNESSGGRRVLPLADVSDVEDLNAIPYSVLIRNIGVGLFAENYIMATTRDFCWSLARFAKDVRLTPQSTHELQYFIPSTAHARLPDLGRTCAKRATSMLAWL